MTTARSAAAAARLSARRSARIGAAAPRGVALVIGRGGRIVTAPSVPDPDGVGVGQCAERTAVYEALLASSPKDTQLRRRLDIREVIVRGGAGGAEDAGPPCGACLQVLAEFAPQARVYWGTSREPRGGLTVAELLPGAFTPSHLAAANHA